MSFKTLLKLLDHVINEKGLRPCTVEAIENIARHTKPKPTISLSLVKRTLALVSWKTYTNIQ